MPQLTDDEVRTAVARLLGAGASPSRIAELLGIGRESVARIAAGMRVRAGTLALAREHLPHIPAPSAMSSLPGMKA